MLSRWRYPSAEESRRMRARWIMKWDWKINIWIENWAERVKNRSEEAAQPKYVKFCWQKVTWRVHGGSWRWIKRFRSKNWIISPHGGAGEGEWKWKTPRNFISRAAAAADRQEEKSRFFDIHLFFKIFRWLRAWAWIIIRILIAQISELRASNTNTLAATRLLFSALLFYFVNDFLFFPQTSSFVRVVVVALRSHGSPHQWWLRLVRGLSMIFSFVVRALVAVAYNEVKEAHSFLFMNGQEIFGFFTQSSSSLDSLLTRNGKKSHGQSNRHHPQHPNEWSNKN